MATLAESDQDFSRLPDLPADVFTAPLKKPAHVGDDWLEPKQTVYDSEDDAIWIGGACATVIEGRVVFP